MEDKESKVSRAKRKRLDKYIEHQLKREEKKALLEKLSKTKMDTDKFTSSKTLGKGNQFRKDRDSRSIRTRTSGKR